jgi:hypothetical protein
LPADAAALTTTSTSHPSTHTNSITNQAWTRDLQGVRLHARLAAAHIMAMLTFHTLFPDEADAEYQTVIPYEKEGIPTRPFLFVELYCVEPECDCRRVMLNVVDIHTDQHVATINYAFEPPEPPFDDLGQWFLDWLNPQSEVSDAFLELFTDMIANDRGYHDRLVSHYEMWKRAVEDPKHPDQPTIGANDPCPCGSGRKYERCCRA